MTRGVRRFIGIVTKGVGNAEKLPTPHSYFLLFGFSPFFPNIRRRSGEKIPGERITIIFISAPFRRQGSAGGSLYKHHARAEQSRRFDEGKQPPRQDKGQKYPRAEAKDQKPYHFFQLA